MQHYYNQIEDTVMVILRKVYQDDQLKIHSMLSNQLMDLLGDFFTNTDQLRDCWTEDKFSLTYYRLYHHTRAYVRCCDYDWYADRRQFHQVMVNCELWLREISDESWVKCTGTIKDFTQTGADFLAHKFACLLLFLVIAEVMHFEYDEGRWDDKQIAVDIAELNSLISAYKVPFTGRSELKVRFKWVYRFINLAYLWVEWDGPMVNVPWEAFRVWCYHHYNARYYGGSPELED